MAEYYSCILNNMDQLKLYHSDKVRWLDIDLDIELIKKYYEVLGNKIQKEDFNDKWRLCALIVNNDIISFGGALFMTSWNWEIGAVSTHPQFRNKGYAKIVCSFIAHYILENGKQATCNTDTDNIAMQKVMQAIGMVQQ